MKRIIACVSLVLGIGIGIVFGPIVGIGPAEAGKRTYSYRCVGAGDFGTTNLGGTLAVYVTNLSSKSARVTRTLTDSNGMVSPSSPSNTFTIVPRGQESLAFGAPAIVRFRSNRPLLIDGFVDEFLGAAENQIRQARCT